MLQDKTVIVAGVGPGLGEEIARLALAEGANVVIGARNEQRLASIAKELDAGGTRIAHVACDLGPDGDVESLARTALDHFGRIDALACVAAKIDVDGTIETTPPQAWRDVYEVNVVGTVRVIQSALPALKERGGSIVIIGSQSEVHPKPAPGFIAYGAAKAAMHSAMIYMTQQLGPFGIRVNRVVPSTMWTPTLEGFAGQMAKAQNVPIEDIKSGFEGDMPLGRMPSGADAAEAAVFLLSDRARSITGQALFVNSGEWLA